MLVCRFQLCRRYAQSILLLIFLQAINSHCFQALFNIPAAHQKLVVDSVVWAIKHTERNISDTVSICLYLSVTLLSYLFCLISFLLSIPPLGTEHPTRVATKCWKDAEHCPRILSAIPSSPHPRCICRHD